MTEIVGGIMMISGGSMLLGAGLHLGRWQRFSAELVTALPFTPVPVPDAELDQLVASID